MRWDCRTASRVVEDSPVSSDLGASVLCVEGLRALTADSRDGGTDESKRFPREDREVFEIAIDVGRFMRFGEQETLSDTNLLQLKSLTLFGVFDP